MQGVASAAGGPFHTSCDLVRLRIDKSRAGPMGGGGGDAIETK